MNEEWVSSRTAAERLGVTVNHVGWLGAQGRLEVSRLDARRMVRLASLVAYEHEIRRWITLVEAGRMIGVSSKTAQRLARRGWIHQRRAVGTRLPSIERASVESYLRGLESRPGDETSAD